MFFFFTKFAHVCNRFGRIFIGFSGFSWFILHLVSKIFVSKASFLPSFDQISSSFELVFSG